MAKTATLQEFARIGAAVRIRELQDEIASIRKDFPGVGGEGPVVKRRPGRPKAQATPVAESPAATPAPPKRKRRKMSAAARKAIGDAQRKRWAKLKAGKKA